MNQVIRDTRFLPAMAGAGAVSFALFLFMHQLVATNPQALKAPPRINPIDIVKVQKPKPPPIINKRRLKRPKPHTQPKMQGPITSHMTPHHLPPIINVTSFPGDNSIWIPPGTRVTRNGGGSTLEIAVRFTPQYPPQAAMQGIEGYVKTCFTVAADGTVVDPRVVGASSPQARALLGQSALQTILRWKFFPRKLDGKAVATPNVCQDIRFTLH